MSLSWSYNTRPRHQKPSIPRHSSLFAGSPWRHDILADHLGHELAHPVRDPPLLDAAPLIHQLTVAQLDCLPRFADQ